MTLPSNSSMHVFPHNTLTAYDTLLAEYVTSPSQLECALQEITCPTSWYNVKAETLVLIEGVQSKGQEERKTNIRRLVNVLRRHSRDQVHMFKRQNTANYDARTKECLERGVEISRTLTYEPVLPTPTHTTETPSGGKLDNPENDTDEEEMHEARHKRAVPAFGSSVDKEVKEVPPIDEEAVPADMEPCYHEKGVFTNTGSRSLSLSETELKALNLALNIQDLDKAVASLHFKQRRIFRAFSLQGAYLQDNPDLISYLNKMFNRNNPVTVRKLKQLTKNQKATVFSYNRYTMKCTINLPPQVILQLPDNLGLQLGFEGITFVAGKTEGSHVVDLKFRAHTVYVYSDIVKHSIVGDKRAPLLRVVPVNPLLGEMQTVSFQPLIYQPVTKTNFRQIGIYLRDGTGRPIPFERGAVNVVLAFRPISSIQR